MSESIDSRGWRTIPSLLMGLLIGALVFSDAYLANWLRLRILKIFPFEITTLVLVGFCALVLAAIYLCQAKHDLSSLFTVVFLLALQTSSLFTLAIFNADEVAIMVFLFLLFLLTLLDKNFAFTRSPINLFNLALLLVIVISLVNGLNPRLFLIFVKSSLLSFLMINLVNRRERIHRFIRYLILFTVLSSLLAIVQEAVYVLTGNSLVGLMSSNGVVTNGIHMGSFLRVPAFFSGGYKQFAIVLLVGLMILANLLFHGGGRVLSPKGRTFPLAAAFLLMLAALILTFSQDTILAFMLLTPLAVAVRWPSRLIHLTVLLVIALGITWYFGLWDFAGKHVASEIKYGEFRQRVELDREGMEGFLRGDWRSFLTGRGLGNGKFYTTHHKEWPAHNAFILAADEIGLIGLGVYACLFLFVLYRLLAAGLAARDPADRAIMKGLLFGLLALLIVYQFHAAFIEPFTWLYLALAERASALVLKQPAAVEGVLAPA